MKLKKADIFFWGIFVVILGFFLYLWYENRTEDPNAQAEKVDSIQHHLHGLFYDQEKGLVAATHAGIMQYDKDGWVKISPERDYMGFAITDRTWYSSGHPPASSNEPNPLGLIQSTDKGKTWSTIDFAGESDFHHLAASHRTGTLYVYNQQPNQKMQVGLYYSTDQGKNWTKSTLSGVEATEVWMVKADPNKSNTVALLAKEGLYLSNDTGNTFWKVPVSAFISAMDISFAGSLWAATYEESPRLLKLESNGEIKKEIPLSYSSKEDPIQYITVHPQNENDISFATASTKIYQTKDGGKTWTELSEG
ncbi:F510_1955 family glycosylhydrolase [Risungbinella massiliensis]|uniref:F510_1955 family glycosylhydrolase n=1 Tax=Risungbinella massiliensis TaxID=1329796 RepID=UPI000699EF37|nr:sialidase family protein [Risungbinella massiliensis]